MADRGTIEDRYLYAKRKRNISAREAVEQLLKSIQKPILGNIDADKIRMIVDGKVEAINTVKIILIGINDSEADQSWIREKVMQLSDAGWLAFDTVTTLLEDDIPDEFEDHKLKPISEGKRKAFEQSQVILNSINELNEAISGTRLTLSPKDAMGYIERRAGTFNKNEQSVRQKRVKK